jgi:hypothetical protein
LVLRSGSLVEISLTPDVSSQLVPIGPDGVDLNTIGRTGVCAQRAVAGDVVCLADDGHHVVPSAPDRAATVIGVVSTAPALTLKGTGPEEDDTGCQVTDQNGPIRTGDLLTISSTPGHAMRARRWAAWIAGTLDVLIALA